MFVHTFIRVDTLGRVASKQALYSLLDLGHTRHTTDEDDFTNVAGTDTGITKSLFAWFNGAIDQWLSHRLELGTSKFVVNVLRPGSISSDEGQIDLRL